MNMKVAGHRETRHTSIDKAAFGSFTVKSRPSYTKSVRPRVLRPASLIQTDSTAPANWFAGLKQKIAFFGSVKHCPFSVSGKTCPSNG
jgi:hypothetical protein